MIDWLAESRHQLELFLVNNEIANQDIMFQIHIHTDSNYGSTSLQGEVTHNHTNINIRLGIEISAHFGTIENYAPDLVAKFGLEPIHIFGERCPFWGSEILERGALHAACLSVSRAITMR